MNKKNFVEFVKDWKHTYDCEPTPLDLWNAATQFMEYKILSSKEPLPEPNPKSLKYPLLHSAKLYYIRDSRQFVGNCILFWRKGGGYTCNLDEAETFTKEKAYEIHKNRKSDIPMPKIAMDDIARKHVDMQDVLTILLHREEII